jgi:hypothetical protein
MKAELDGLGVDCSNDLCKRTNWIKVEQIEKHGFVQIARIRRILDDEEARLKGLENRHVQEWDNLPIQGSLATVRKIREMIKC